MKTLAKFLSFLFMVILVNSSYAKDTCISSVNMSSLREKIGSISESYGDLPSRIDCRKPVGNEKMICENDVLRFMEKLDHMGWVYAYENATKRELDHRKPYRVKELNKMLNSCKNQECICSNFKRWADSDLGGMSPYDNN